MADPRPGDDIEIWTGEPTRGTRVSYAIVRGLILVVAKLLKSEELSAIGGPLLRRLARRRPAA